jgi:hypothetical protein
MYLMDSFLGGQFSTYGLDVIRISGMEVSSLFRGIAILSVYPFLKFHRSYFPLGIQGSQKIDP